MSPRVTLLLPSLLHLPQVCHWYPLVRHTILLTLTACHRHFTPDKASLRVLETERQRGLKESEKIRQSEEKAQQDRRHLPIAWCINKPREKLEVSFSRGGGRDGVMKALSRRNRSKYFREESRKNSRYRLWEYLRTLSFTRPSSSTATLECSRWTPQKVHTECSEFYDWLKTRGTAPLSIALSSGETRVRVDTDIYRPEIHSIISHCKYMLVCVNERTRMQRPTGVAFSARMDHLYGCQKAANIYARRNIYTYNFT